MLSHLAWSARRNRAIEVVSGFINRRDTAHEISIIAFSYVFIFFGAWNDGLVGFAPSFWSQFLELIFAFGLLLEIILRVLLAKQKRPIFWAILLLDMVSVLTIVPTLVAVSFMRSGRAVYAGVRLIGLLDRLAYTKKNPLYLITLYPVVVPLVAAVVFALERHTPNSSVRNYFEAVAMCLQFALSLGNVRPSNPWAMTLCGALFVVSLVCIGVSTNVLFARYQRHTP
ncbi:MAG: hypothetical protein NVS2B17_13750 [Candidatus Velthaea sp.]